MKAFTLYIAIAAVAVNVAGNAFQNTAEALEQRTNARIEKLCEINTRYCS